jgi:TetR/AcrR family transcriptional repressor of nem operon
MMTLKANIINESLKLFSLKGFVGTSIQDILSAAKTSKGGFYNHFSSKEALFHQVLNEARTIWRERNLHNLDRVEGHIDKLILLLKNYRDRYLLDADKFPGGCVFIMFAVELGDQCPHLSAEVQKGFVGLKAMIKRFLDQSKITGELSKDVNTETAAEIVFNSMLGASISYSTGKSVDKLNRSINTLIEYLETLKR